MEGGSMMYSEFSVSSLRGGFIKELISTGIKYFLINQRNYVEVIKLFESSGYRVLKEMRPFPDNVIYVGGGDPSGIFEGIWVSYNGRERFFCDGYMFRVSVGSNRVRIIFSGHVFEYRLGTFVRDAFEWGPCEEL